MQRRQPITILHEQPSLVPPKRPWPRLVELLAWGGVGAAVSLGVGVAVSQVGIPLWLAVPPGCFVVGWLVSNRFSLYRNRRTAAFLRGNWETEGHGDMAAYIKERQALNLRTPPPPLAPLIDADNDDEVPTAS